MKTATCLHCLWPVDYNLKCNRIHLGSLIPHNDATPHKLLTWKSNFVKLSVVYGNARWTRSEQYGGDQKKHMDHDIPTCTWKGGGKAELHGQGFGKHVAYNQRIKCNRRWWNAVPISNCSSICSTLQIVTMLEKVTGSLTEKPKRAVLHLEFCTLTIKYNLWWCKFGYFKGSDNKR